MSDDSTARRVYSAAAAAAARDLIVMAMAPADDLAIAVVDGLFFGPALLIECILCTMQFQESIITS